MRVHTVALATLFGMLSMGAAALAVPIPVSSAPRLDAPEGLASAAVQPAVAAPAPLDAAHFTRGKTLAIDARLGHASVARGAAGETYLFASVTATDLPAPKDPPPLNLALVIDRSGSMAGTRIVNAIAAAVSAVERMREGDSVTVISFDTVAKVVVPPTRATAESRAGILSAIRSIRLGGDTCISCGLETAMRELASTSIDREQVNRMILLSDGEPTHGVKDVPGFKALAGRMRDKGFAITTIGVDTNYETKVMAAIAIESDGNHFFVANPSGLPAVFAKEFDTLVASVASNAELVIELAPGVVVDEVFDRSFRREGERIVVPLGTFTASHENTVLLKLKVPTDRDGAVPVATTKLAFRDLVEHAEGVESGELALVVRSDGQEQRHLDPYVAARLERSLTGRAIFTANDLLQKGKLDEARAVVTAQRAKLEVAAREARADAPNAPAKPGRGVAADFEEQTALLGGTATGVDRARAEAAPRPAGGPPARPAQAAGRDAVAPSMPGYRALGF